MNSELDSNYIRTPSLFPEFPQRLVDKDACWHVLCSLPASNWKPTPVVKCPDVSTTPCSLQPLIVAVLVRSSSLYFDA
jgi:hypothetical protein